MKKYIGMMAALAVLGLAAGAQAQSGDISGSGSSSSSGTGGSGSTMGGSTGSSTGSSSGATTGQAQQLEGKVLKADRNSITIEHMGAAIPLQVQSSTAFQGVKSAKDIKEGSQVRASFNLKGAKNELTSVEVLPASQGGSGSNFGGSSGSSNYPSGSSGSNGSSSGGY